MPNFGDALPFFAIFDSLILGNIKKLLAFLSKNNYIINKQYPPSVHLVERIAMMHFFQWVIIYNIKIFKEIYANDKLSSFIEFF
jgi:hypothetical protein